MYTSKNIDHLHFLNSVPFLNHSLGTMSDLIGRATSNANHVPSLCFLNYNFKWSQDIKVGRDPQKYFEFGR